MPGALAAVTVRQQVNVERGLMDLGAPLALFFGDGSVAEQGDHYVRLVRRLGELAARRGEMHADVAAAGFIVNTCSWVDSDGYGVLLRTLEALRADVVVVIENERLYNEIKQDVSKFNHGGAVDVSVLRAPKSSGVVIRAAKERRVARMRKIREYFYGRTKEVK